MKEKVLVAMSGGVDSSVAAALLREQGHPLIGLMLNLWSPDPNTTNRCCSPRDQALARIVAAQLDRKSTRLNSSHTDISRMSSSA